MDPQSDCVTRIRQGTEASVRFQAEHAGYFALLDVERADASHAELLREGGAVYLRDVVGLVTAGPTRGHDPRRRSRAARPRRARRGAPRSPTPGATAGPKWMPTSWPSAVGVWVTRAPGPVTLKRPGRLATT